MFTVALKSCFKCKSVITDLWIENTLCSYTDFCISGFKLIHWVKETWLQRGTAPTWPQRDQAVLADRQGPRPGQHVRQGLHDAFHHLQMERWAHHTLSEASHRITGRKKIIHILTHLISKLLWVKDIKIVQNPSVLLTPSKSHMLISFFFHPLFFFMPAKIFERHLAAFQNFSIHVILLSSSIYLWLLVPLKTVTPTLIRSGKFACSVFMQKRRN